MTAFLAGMVVCGSVGLVAASVAGLKAFREWLAYRREAKGADNALLADALKRLGELEQRMAGAELQKLRR